MTIAEYWKRVSGMQKEKLSALMDGETLDNELLNELSRSSEMQKTWERKNLLIKSSTKRFREYIKI